MEKIIAWCKRHKIWTAVIVTFVIAQIAAPNNPPKTGNSSAASQVVETTLPPATTPTVTVTTPPAPAGNPALTAWATSFYNNYWSSCYPDWQYVVNNEDGASGPYGITTGQVIDNDCGSLVGNSPDATINNDINALTADELNWSIDLQNTTNGMYSGDFQTLNNDFERLNSEINAVRNN